jgi:cob(I)alamin adenosyltransferase
MKQGLIEVYCGDGKGKTTAALGLILRASGRGLKVILCQFLKGWETGELKDPAALPGWKFTGRRASPSFLFR